MSCPKANALLLRRLHTLPVPLQEALTEARELGLVIHPAWKCRIFYHPFKREEEEAIGEEACKQAKDKKTGSKLVCYLLAFIW